MADKSSQTEKPTPRRLQRAREQGQFVNSRQFVAGVQFAVMVLALSAGAGAWFHHMQQTTAVLLTRAGGGDLGADELVVLLREIAWRVMMPLGAAGIAVLLLMVLTQFLVTGFGLNTQGLSPNFDRLNPITRLGSLWHDNMRQFFQAILLLPIFLYAAYGLSRETLELFFTLPLTGLMTAFAEVSLAFRNLLWKAAALFFVLGAIDLMRERRRYIKGLMMSPQEIREELKESEGSPQMKGRIRRFQRDFARRRMLQQVPTATAVIVNPTHYAIALRYELESNAAPVVVAKGKNYIARRIRELAIEHQIPIVENPPLAQALYKSVAVGQEIPMHFYKAVAEILAYVYRLVNQHRRR